MPGEFDELKLQVSLVDNATAQLKSIQGEPGSTHVYVEMNFPSESAGEKDQ
jgi:hypothetical protein